MSPASDFYSVSLQCIKRKVTRSSKLLLTRGKELNLIDTIVVYSNISAGHLSGNEFLMLDSAHPPANL